MEIENENKQFFSSEMGPGLLFSSFPVQNFEKWKQRKGKFFQLKMKTRNETKCFIEPN